MKLFSIFGYDFIVQKSKIVITKGLLTGFFHGKVTEQTSEQLELDLSDSSKE